MYFVYALKSLNHNYIYVGFSENICRRISEHSNGFCRSTKPYRPFKLIYYEKCETRIEARKREKFFKNGFGKRYLQTLNDEISVIKLNMCRHHHRWCKFES